MSIRVTLFCGGRGSATIIRALLRQGDVELTLLVNAYDDGLSTGALRNFIPGMLGPSDFRKNLSCLFGNYSHAQYALKSLMEYRLTGGTAEIEKLACFTSIGDPAPLDEPIKHWFAQLPPATSQRMRALLARFFALAAGTSFDYRDCSLGNLVFAGAYLEHGNDFNAAAAIVADLVGTRARLLNVGEQQNRILLGLKHDGTLLASEAEIVGPQSSVPITDLYLLTQPLAPDDLQALAAMDATGKRKFLSARDSVPALRRRRHRLCRYHSVRPRHPAFLAAAQLSHCRRGTGGIPSTGQGAGDEPGQRSRHPGPDRARYPGHCAPLWRHYQPRVAQ
jgi:2-phospho-L-lactate transferase/gluconeogenesis factor (CofD/UPF0052 family)